jgi:SpoVK/Ycf46/Vps4 family AAA+-type ATPase
VRDKYVGESEKQIKAIFERYRDCVKNSREAPILLFNEADAIISRRTQVGDINGSVTKMENSLQNIILEELENLEGIMIATTNLTENMDSAFSRRFLYKIDFEMPNAESRRAIWLSLMPHLSASISAEEIDRLAAKYNLSGGQIENIARKQTVDAVLQNAPLNITVLDAYCREELADSKEKKAIGFLPDIGAYNTCH